MLYRNIKLLKQLEFSGCNGLFKKQLHISNALSCAKNPKGAKSTATETAKAAKPKKGPQEKVTTFFKLQFLL